MFMYNNFQSRWRILTSVLSKTFDTTQYAMGKVTDNSNEIIFGTGSTYGEYTNPAAIGASAQNFTVSTCRKIFYVGC